MSKMRDTLSLKPLSTEEWEKLPDRERQLSAIADQVAYWIKWTTRNEGDDFEVTPDTHVWLNGYEGAPPHWPSISQLTRWLMVLRNTPAPVVPTVKVL